MSSIQKDSQQNMPSVSIDLAGLSAGSRLTEEQTSALVESCASLGYVRLLNHGISHLQLQQVFDWSREFFAWPDSVKQSANRAKNGPFRGFAGVGCECIGVGVGDSQPVKDVKESFDCGSCKDHVYPTPWPTGHEKCDEFRILMQSFYQDCVGVHDKILSIFEAALGLNNRELRTLCSDGNGEVRLAHYPACPVASLKTGTTFRIAEHKDVGVFTLLFQDSVGGLEIEGSEHSDRFLPVQSARFGEMILIVGETLNRWTCQSLRSPKHRVLDPPESPINGFVPERYSVGFFGKANRTASIMPLARFRKISHAQLESSHYENRTAQEFYNSAHEQTATG